MVYHPLSDSSTLMFDSSTKSFRDQIAKNLSFFGIDSNNFQNPQDLLRQLVSMIPIRASNQAPTIVAKSVALSGDLTIPKFENTFEVFGYTLAGSRSSVPGMMGDLQASSYVRMSHILLVVPNGPVVTKALTAITDGEMIGPLNIAFLRNTGTALTDITEVAHEWKFENPRISVLIVGSDVTVMVIGYSSLVMSYNRKLENATAAGHISAGYNLSTNQPI